MVMSKFVKELTEEVEELERKIEEKKKDIQIYSTKGATSDNQRRELKIALTNKIQQEEKKKAILKAQYEKSIETINLIKGYLENVFTSIDVEPEIIEKLSKPLPSLPLKTPSRKLCNNRRKHDIFPGNPRAKGYRRDIRIRAFDSRGKINPKFLTIFSSATQIGKR